MKANDWYEAVVNDPDNDELRLGYAGALKASGDPWGRFVELQVTRTREQRLRGISSSQSSPRSEEAQIFRSEHQSSVRQILKYAVPRDVAIEVHRGFVVCMHCDPRIFLEHGAYLFRIAPLRGVRFKEPFGDEPRLLHELLSSPLLQRLDYVGLEHWRLSDEEWVRVFESENLTRCISLNLGGSCLPGPSSWERIARGRLATNLIDLSIADAASIARTGYMYEDVPSAGRHVGDWIRGYEPTPALGQKLEQERGYVPWLHPEQNMVHRWDRRYFLDTGALPHRPIGSPVDYVADPDDGDPRPEAERKLRVVFDTSMQDWRNWLENVIGHTFGR